MEYKELIFSKIEDSSYGVGDSSKKNEYANGIVGGTSAEGGVIIPKRVNNILVTEILTNAFRECTKITSIKIEAPIKIIQGDAFYHCCALESIIIPKTVEIIKDAAFSMSRYFVNINRTSPFLVIFEKGTKIKKLGNRLFEAQQGLTLILPVYKFPSFTGNIFPGVQSEIYVYTYTRGLNASGISTMKIEPSMKDRIYTCYCKKSRASFVYFTVFLCLHS